MNCCLWVKFINGRNISEYQSLPWKIKNLILTHITLFALNGKMLDMNATWELMISSNIQTCKVFLQCKILVTLYIIIVRAGKKDKDGFWSIKKKLIIDERFVPCYTYEKPTPVQLGTYDAVVSLIKVSWNQNSIYAIFRLSLLLKWTKSKTWHLRFIKATVTLILTILDVEAIAWYFLIRILETFQFLVKWDMKLCKYRISILVRIDLMIYDAILEL